MVSTGRRLLTYPQLSVSYRFPSGVVPASETRMNTHQHFGGVVCRGYSWPALTADGVAFFVDRKMKRNKKAPRKPLRIGVTAVQETFGHSSSGELLAFANDALQEANELKFLAACKGAPLYGPDEEEVVMVSYNEVWFPQPCDLVRN